MSQRPLVLLCFFLSGATSLIYEILWTRFLGDTIGNTHFSITLVVSVFMGGLALGSAVGGRWADRSRNLLRLYAILTILIAILCLLIPLGVQAGKPMFAALYRQHDGNPEAPILLTVRILFCSLLLLVPTTFMGATLPILSRHFTRSLGTVGSTVGRLYALNTLGAVAGATWTGFFGIRQLGLWGSNWVAAGIDIACGIAILVVARRAEIPANEAATPVSSVTSTDVPRLPAAIRLAVIAFAIAGFANMILQIAWTKALVLTIGNSTYAFSLIVTLFILGIALGGGFVTLFVDRIRNLQVALGTCIFVTGVVVALTVPLLGYFPVLGARLFDQVETPSYARFLWIQIFLVSAAILPATILMGTIFPIVGRIRARTLSRVGHAIGAAYFWNTFGSILGTLAAGFVFIPLFGRVFYSLYLGAGLSVIMGLTVILSGMARPLPIRLGTVSALALVVAFPSYLLRPYGIWGQDGSLWHPSLLSQGAYVATTFRYAYSDRDGNRVSAEQFIDHAIRNNQIRSYEEGIHAPVAVVTNPSGAVAMRISGKVEASLAPDGGYNNDLPHQIMAGHLPMILHPDPKNVLTLGLGGGVTLGTLTIYPVERVDSLEISPEVIEAARNHFAEANRGALDSDRVRNIIGDGRNHLEYTTESYDVITSVPSNPWIAGIGNLFTVRFFEICRDRLTEDGVICNWIHKINMRDDDFRTVVRTFIEVFGEHAQIWDLGYDALLIGSKQPIRLDATRFRELLKNPQIAKDLRGLGVDDIGSFLRHYKADVRIMREFTNATDWKPLNTDTRPVLEFSCPFGLYGHQLDAYRGLVKAGVTEGLDWVTGLADDEAERARALRQTFHRYLLAFIRVVELEGTVAKTRRQKRGLRQEVLLKKAEEVIGDLVGVAHGIRDAGGDRWLDARSSSVAKRALGVEPADSLATTLAGWLTYAGLQQQDTDEAKRYLERALPFAMDNPLTALEAARLCARVGDQKQGADILIAAQPEVLARRDSEEHLRFAEVCVAVGLAQRGMETLDRIPEAARKDARYWLVKGALHRTMGQAKEAVEAFQSGEPLGASREERSRFHLELGLTLQNIRQFEEAARFYRQALQLDPNNVDAQRRLESIQKRLSTGSNG